MILNYKSDLLEAIGFRGLGIAVPTHEVMNRLIGDGPNAVAAFRMCSQIGLLTAVDHNLLICRELTAGDSLQDNRWRFIESVPNDGTQVLLWAPKWPGVFSGLPFLDCWNEIYGSGTFKARPTHWRSLPNQQLPSVEEEGRGNNDA